MNTPSYLRIFCSLALILLAQAGRAELPDLQPIDFQVPAVSKSPAPAVISYSVTFTNNSAVGLDGFWVYKLYWSADAALDSTDVEVGSFYRGTPIPPGGTLSSYGEVTLPAVVRTTNGWIILKADAGEDLPDSNRLNNVSAAPFSFELIEPDLQPIDFQVPSQMRGYASPTISYSVTFTNGGAADLTNLWVYKLYWSADDMLDSTDVAIGSSHGRTSILVGDTWVSSGQVTAGPIRTHTNGWVILKADAEEHAPDSDRGNNIVARPLSFELLPPSDLRPINLRLTNSTIVSTANPYVTASWDLTNSGPGDLTHQRVNYTTWLSTNADMSNSTLLEKTTLWGTQAVHQVRAISSSFVLRVARSGRYYLFVSVDPDNEVPEADDLNNTAVLPFDFELQGYDLAIVPGVTYTNLTSSVEAWVDVTFSTFNAGSFAASNWNAAIYFSTNAILDSSDPLLRTSSCSAAVGEVVPHSASICLPVTESGRYYLIEASDSPNWVPELNESNNTQVVTVDLNILYPDLEPVSLEVPATYTGPEGGPFTVAYTLTNHAPALSMGHLQWFDAIYLSTNGVLDDQSILLAGYWNSSLPGGFSQLTITNDVVMPAYISGNARIFVRANARGLLEPNTNNNVMSSPIEILSNSPDLMPLISAVPSLVRSFPPPSVTVAWGITNAGSGTAVGPLAREIYFSKNATLERESDVQLLGVWDDPSLKPGEQRQTEDSVSVPVTNSAPGYLIFTCYRSDFPNEVNSSNNTVAVAIQFDTGHFDLVALPIVYRWQLTNNSHYNVITVWGVSNAGPDKVEANWPLVTCSLVSSRDSSYDSNDLLLSSVKLDSGLSAGDVLWFTNYLVVSMTNVDSLHLLVCADATQELAEVNERNNITSVLFASPDLAAAPLTIPSDLIYTPYSKISFTVAATNIGLRTISSPCWGDKIYISRKPYLDDQASELNHTEIDKALAPGEGYARREQLTLPVTESGTYSLFFVTGYGASQDSNPINNQAVKTLNIQVERAELQPLVFRSVTPSTVLPNPTMEFVAGVTNHGPGAAYANGTRRDSLVLSRDAVLDSSDNILTSKQTTQVQPAQSLLWITNEVTLPITESGTYYVFWVVDEGNTVLEENESNNVIMTAVTLVVTPPDLSPIRFEVPSVLSGAPYPQVEVIYAVTNCGTGAAQGEWWEDAIYLAGNPDSKISLSEYVSDVPVGGLYWRTNLVRLPITNSGTFEIVFEANPYRDLFEAGYVNNTITNRITFTAELPDIAPIRLIAPATLILPEDQEFTLSYAVTNSGTGFAMPPSLWLDQILLSTDPIPSADDLKCLETYPNWTIEPQATRWFSETIRFAGVAPGTYYLIVVANADNSLIESSTANNVLALPVTIRERKPDLVVQHFRAPALITNPVSSLTFQWFVMNQGLGGVPEGSSWGEGFTLSRTPDVDYRAYALGWENHRGALPPGIGYWVTNTSWIVLTNDGDFYFVLEANTDSDTSEISTANNTMAVPVKVQLSKPDLAIIDIQTPSSIQAHPGAPIEVRWGITNAGPGATRPDSQVVATIEYRGSRGLLMPLAENECPVLPPGGSAYFTNTFRFPSEAWIALDLVFRVDPSSYQIESTRDNNQVNRPILVTLLQPDLEVSVVSYPTNLIFAPGQPVQFVYAVTNVGLGTAEIAYSDFIHFSDPFEEVSVSVAIYTGTNALAPGEGARFTNEVAMPYTLGGGLAFAQLTVNSERVPPESNWENNSLILPMQLEQRLSDLSASLSILETNATGPNPSVLVHWALTNLGPGDCYPSSYDRIRFGLSQVANGAFDTALLEIPLPELIPAAAAFTGTNTIRLDQWGGGLRYLVMRNDGVGEVTSTNNTASAAFYLDNLPDLTIPTLMAPPVLTGAPNQKVTLITEVKNQGTGAAKPFWRYWISIYSPRGENRSEFVAYSPYPGISNALNPGESQWFTNIAAIPSVASGDYRWIAHLDFQADANPENNFFELPVQVNLFRPSQLRAVSLTADAKATLTTPLAEVRWSVVNDGDGLTAFNWIDSIYYSSDDRFTLDDTLVCTRTNLAGLASGATYSWQTSVAFPSDAKSGAFLILVVDGDHALWDEAPENNTLATVLRIAPFGSGRTWLTEPRFVNGRFQASLHGVAGQSVVLQASTNLVDWESLRALTFQTEELDIEDTNSGGSAPRFYRLIPLSELE